VSHYPGESLDRRRFGVHNQQENPEPRAHFGDYADPARTVALAREAENAGWHAFFLWDHVLAWDGNIVADPCTLLAAVAASTERIRLGTMVTPLARRRPWQIVRQVVTLDHLSHGRAVLRVGLGYPPHEEFEVFGESGEARGRAELLDESLEIVVGLMGGEPFSTRAATSPWDR